ncbi:MAG: hypothetical protein JSW12_05125, partial [Deltaproteobacteria bacterium]
WTISWGEYKWELMGSIVGHREKPIDPAKSTSDFRLYKKVDIIADAVQSGLYHDLTNLIHINH